MLSSVRIDKFLWSVRLFKTRSLATDCCKSGKIKINNIVCKASKTVEIGNIIEVQQKGIKREYKVLDLLENRVSAKLVPNYILDITTEEELLKMKMQQDMRRYYHEKGTGRPSKKDRREIEAFKKGFSNIK